MNAWYVERSPEGTITGLYANPQPGQAEELLAADASEVVAYLQRLQPGGATVVAAQKQAAINALHGTNPAERLARAMLKVMYQSLVEIRDVSNQLLARVSPDTPALPTPSWEQWLDSIRQAIDQDNINDHPLPPTI